MPTWARRLRTATVIGFLVPGAVLALSLNAMADSPSPAPSGSVALPGDPTKGQQVYNQNCTSCHGANLEGSSIGPRLNPIAKLKGVANPLDPTYLIDTITNGRPGQPDGFSGMMPAWGGKLSDQDIKDVTSYVIQQNSAGTSGALTAVDLARSNVFWVTVGVGVMVLLTYLLAAYNMRWIARRYGARRTR